ncbi:MAG TPA: ATP-binding protein [Vicinamibacterales bacterium]
MSCAADPEATANWVGGAASLVKPEREALCVPVMAFGAVQAVLYAEKSVATGAPLSDAVSDLEAAATQLALCLVHRQVAGRVEAGRRRGESDERRRRSEAVATLAGGIAHDFNNHLTVINGLCDLLLDDARLDPLVRTDLQEIRSAGENAATLTNQLLAYSGRQILQPEPTDVNALLARAQASLRRMLGDGIGLSLDLAPVPAWAHVDEEQVKQVFLNLAANARDAMRGAGTVTIRTDVIELGVELRDAQPALPPGAYVRASMTDTGPGISADVFPRIFDPFFTTASTGERMGLGLAVAYGILRQLGGGIAVDRGEGSGATFTLYFPRVAAPAGIGGDEPDMRTRGDERILIVEDRDDVRRLAIQVLSKQGYEILAAPDGPAALQLAAATDAPIDLLVTDVVMPGMNGRELANALVAVRPGLKVLYTSGFTADQIGACGVLEEGTAYLRKPFSPQQLRARVRQVLDERADRGC